MLATLSETPTTLPLVDEIGQALVDIPLTQAPETMISPVVASKPLPLRGSRGVRDLGGYAYATPDGATGCTATGTFLRGGSLYFLTASDLDLLRAYGLTRVIDLRSAFELRMFPDSFCKGKHRDIDYVSVPMMDGLNARGIRGKIPAHMSDAYCNMLDDDAASIGAVFEALDTEGCVLFHCRQGKDRTGVIAMLLLKLAGVADGAVVADYAVSDHYTGRTTGLQHVGLTILARRSTRCVFKSDSDEMTRTLAHLQERYGTARLYLEEAAGVPAAVLDRITARLRGRRTS